MKLGSTIKIEICEVETTGAGNIQDRLEIIVEGIPDGQAPTALSLVAAAFADGRLGGWESHSTESGDERGGVFYIEKLSWILKYEQLVAVQGVGPEHTENGDRGVRPVEITGRLVDYIHSALPHVVAIGPSLSKRD